MSRINTRIRKGFELRHGWRMIFLALLLLMLSVGTQSHISVVQACGGGMSASQIDSYLSCYGSPMNGTGGTHMSAGRYYNVDPRLVVAIAGAESSFGKNGYCASQRHNAWGYGGGWPSCWNFNSWDDGIWQVTWQLNDYIYKRGLTNIRVIGQTWCGSGCTYWESNVRYFYAEQGGNPDTNDLSYYGNGGQ